MQFSIIGTVPFLPSREEIRQKADVMGLDLDSTSVSYVPFFDSVENFPPRVCQGQKYHLLIVDRIVDY